MTHRAAATCVATITLALGAVPGLVGSPDARLAAAKTVLGPPAKAPFSYQIGGAFAPEPGVLIVDRDRLARPAIGLYNICYVNAFQAQPQARRWWLAHHPDLLLFRHGHPVIDRTWQEQLLDTSTAPKRRALARIVGSWIAGCAHAGFQAVEPDNLDSWDRSQGALTARANLALAALLIARAHRLGLAIAQKNAAEVAPTGRRLGFDFAIAEECQPYGECGAYTRAYGREVIEIEYPDNGGPAGFAAACRARGQQISIVYRDRKVTPAGQPGHVEQRCG
jgi:Glycoside-hydrolase family GH114